MPDRIDIEVLAAILGKMRWACQMQEAELERESERWRSDIKDYVEEINYAVGFANESTKETKLQARIRKGDI